MRKKDIVKMLKESSETFVPDVLDKVKSNSGELFPSVVCEVKEKPRAPANRGATKAVFAACLAIVVLFAGITALAYAEDDSYIFIDINPSIEIVAKRNGTVKSLSALNAQAEGLIGDDYKGRDVEEVVGEIIDKAIELGYIENEEENEILISVSGKNRGTQQAVLEKVFLKISGKLESKNIKGNITKQAVSKADKAEADKYNISPGKLLLIEEIIKLDPARDIDGLKDKSVKELRAIYKSLTKKHGR